MNRTAYLITWEPIVGLTCPGDPPAHNQTPGPSLHDIDDPLDAHVVFVRDGEDRFDRLSDAVMRLYSTLPGPIDVSHVRVWDLSGSRPKLVERVVIE